MDKKPQLIVGPDYVSEICPLIDEAKTNVLIMMFDWRWYENDFSSPVSQINQALLRATRRKVTVMVLTNYKGVVDRLNDLGILAKEWTGSRLMHAKCVSIDNAVLVIGSHNFTANAMGQNVEVSSILFDVAIADNFSKYFQTLWLS